MKKLLSGLLGISAYARCCFNVHMTFLFMAHSENRSFKELEDITAYHLFVSERWDFLFRPDFASHRPARLLVFQKAGGDPPSFLAADLCGDQEDGP